MSTEDQDRKAFEDAVTIEGMHVNLSRIGPASENAGEYADVIVQTCWHVWQLALAYARREQGKEIDQPMHLTTSQKNYYTMAHDILDTLDRQAEEYGDLRMVQFSAEDANHLRNALAVLRGAR